MPISHNAVGFTLMLGALSALPPLGIDMSLPALPALATDLATSPAAAGATLGLFLLGFALAPLLFGPLSDRFGRRPVLLAGVAAFAAAGLLCAAAPSIGWVLAGRLLQGMGAGAGAAMPLAIVRDLFEGTAARIRLSTVTLVLSVAPLVAPALGSLVVPIGGWRGIYLALGAGAAALWVVAALGFAESMPSDLRQSLQPAHLIARYRGVLGHRVTAGFSVVNALSFACMFAFISGSPLVLMTGRGLGGPAFSAVFACAGCGVIAGAFLNGRLAGRGVATSRILTGGLLLGAVATLALLLLSLIGRDGLGALVPLVMLSNAAFGLVSPNAAHEALQPMRAAAGVASAVFRCAQMLAGAAASTLVPLLFRGYPAAMTGVMAGCAVAALMIYLAALRRPGTTTLEVAPAPAASVARRIVGSERRGG